MNIIERLKINTSAFGLMDAELREVAEKIGFGFFHLLSGDGTWEIERSSFHVSYCYRLRADWVCDHREKTYNLVAPEGNGYMVRVTVCKWCGYEVKPEPKMEWVTCDIERNSVNGAYIFTLDKTPFGLYFATGMFGFGGIKFKPCPCFYKRSDFDRFWMKWPSPCEEHGPMAPVAVRFWQEASR